MTDTKQLTCPSAIRLATLDRPYDELVDYWYAPAVCDCDECMALHRELSKAEAL
jgi:hypothetical protein